MLKSTSFRSVVGSSVTPCRHHVTACGTTFSVCPGHTTRCGEVQDDSETLHPHTSTSFDTETPLHSAVTFSLDALLYFSGLGNVTRPSDDMTALVTAVSAIVHFGATSTTLPSARRHVAVN